MEQRGRLLLLRMPRWPKRSARVLDFMAEPRSACARSQPGETLRCRMAARKRVLATRADSLF